MLGASAHFVAKGPHRWASDPDGALVAPPCERRRGSVLLAASCGHGICHRWRVNLSVETQPTVDDGVMTAAEIGIAVFRFGDVVLFGFETSALPWRLVAAPWRRNAAHIASNLLQPPRENAAELEADPRPSPRR